MHRRGLPDELGWSPKTVALEREPYVAIGTITEAGTAAVEPGLYPVRASSSPYSVSVKEDSPLIFQNQQQRQFFLFYKPGSLDALTDRPYDDGSFAWEAHT